LELLTGEIEASPIVGFCKSVISRHTETWPPKEEALAEEFVEWLGLKTFLTRDKLIELCLSKRVNLSFVELPPELRGFNCSYQDKTEVVITQHETVLGADLHNISHEFREVLENGFVELGHSTLGAGDSLEVRAEHFAMSARMMVVAREIPAYLDTVSNAESTWVRYLGFGVLGFVGLVYLLSCVLLPHFEEIESQTNRQRYIRT